MYEEHNESRIPAVWLGLHILAIILTIVKLFGGISNWPWWLVWLPFIFDLVLSVSIIFGIGILFCFTRHHRNH